MFLNLAATVLWDTTEIGQNIVEVES